MKRFAFAFAAFFLLAHAVSALHSGVTFTSRRGEVFQLVLDGRLVNQKGTNHIRLDLLPPGAHHVELRLLGPYDVLRHRAQIVLYAGYETNYLVQVFNHRDFVRLRKVGMVPVAFTRPAVPVVPVPPSAPPAGERPRYREPGSATAGCRFLLPEQALDRLLDDLTRQQPDSRRIALARQAIGGGSILTDDLRQMLELLQAEEARLELAKYGYGSVCDKQNFYKLFSLFDYDESVRELEQHMQPR